MRELIINHQNLEKIAKNILQRGVTFSFKAQGTSMSPFIRDGDMVRIKQQRLYRVGDVVLLKTQFGLIVHRIITLTPDGVLTRGDNSLASDNGLIGVEHILGRVIQVYGTGLNFHLYRPFSYLLSKNKIRRCVNIKYIRIISKLLLIRARKTS